MYINARGQLAWSGCPADLQVLRSELVPTLAADGSVVGYRVVPEYPQLRARGEHGTTSVVLIPGQRGDREVIVKMTLYISHAWGDVPQVEWEIIG